MKKILLNEKNKLRLKIVLFIIVFLIIREVISNWDDFKLGLTGKPF